MGMNVCKNGSSGGKAEESGQAGALQDSVEREKKPDIMRFYRERERERERMPAWIGIFICVLKQTKKTSRIRYIKQIIISADGCNGVCFVC